MSGICFFNTAIAWGGGEKWHFEVSSHLFSEGYEVFVIAHSKSVLYQKLRAAKIPCVGIELSNLSILNPFKYFKVKKLLQKSNFKTLVINLSRDLKIAGLAAHKAGVHRIIYRRGSAIPIKDNFINRYYFKHILTEVLANSEATKKTVTQNNTNLIAKNKITVIHNGISIPEDIIAYHEVMQKTKPFRLLTLGRLENQKNQSFLINVAQVLKQRGLAFELLIGGEGRLKANLEKEIREHDLSDIVKLKGFIEKPLDFIKQGHVFVLPSLWEGFGYVLAEAALCKKPIVAFNLSSNPELVLDNKTGFLVPENDIHAFADKIIELYKDAPIRMKMGEEGFNHIKTNFDKKLKIREIENYLIS